MDRHPAPRRSDARRRDARFDTLDAPGLRGSELTDSASRDLSCLDGLPNVIGVSSKGPLRVSNIPDATAARLTQVQIAGLVLDGGERLHSSANLNVHDTTGGALHGLGHLPNLKVRSIWSDRDTNLDGFIPGPAFADRWAENSGLRDIYALTTAVKLGMVRGKTSQNDDISARAAKTRMKQLFLTGTQVFDLSPVATMSGLGLFSFSDTSVTDISPRVGLPDLVGVDINITRVTDFTPLLPPDMILRIKSDQITNGSNLLDFIAANGGSAGHYTSKKSPHRRTDGGKPVPLNI